MIRHYRNGAKIGPFKIFWKRNSITIFKRGRKLIYANAKTGTVTF